MPYTLDKLSDRKVKTSKNTTGKKEYLGDGGGLVLQLNPNGSKYWVLKFYLNKKPTEWQFGQFPETSLKEARAIRTQGKLLAKQGIHPKDHFNEIKDTNLKALDDTFTFNQTYEETIKELELRKLADTSIRRYKGIYDLYFRKQIGKLSLFKVDKKIIRTTLLEIPKIKTKQQKEDDNKTVTVQQATYLLNHIFKHAENIGYDGGNHTPTIQSLNLPKPTNKFHPYVHPDNLGEYWNKIKGLEDIQDRVYAKLNLITVLRVNSQSSLTWSMFDPQMKRLKIPQEFMKNRNAFITYLPDEIVDDLIKLREFKDKTNKEKVRIGYKPQYKTGDDDFIFSTPDARINHNHYDNNKLAKIIKRLGDNFKHASAHGNRTLFTILARRFAEVPHEAVEFQLSHNRGNKKNIAINHYHGLIDDWDGSRIKLVNWWIKFLNDKEKAYKLSNITIEKAQKSKSKKSN